MTGSNGFVGRALCAYLSDLGISVRSAVRSLASGGAGAVAVGDIGPDTDWTGALEDIDSVVHLAARVHMVWDKTHGAEVEYRRINVEATRHLASAAAAQGVRRFVLLSSAKVNGQRSQRPLTEADTPHPEDSYALSKWEAEQALVRVGRETGMDWVILRPPLVYGPGVRANFLSLMRAVAARAPLPFAAIDNRRSLLYLGNLVDAITTCLQHPHAPGKTFLVSDGEDLSTPDLVRRLAKALHVPPRLIPVPSALLSLAAALTGKRATVDRLVSSFEIDASAIRATLQWTPPFSVDRGLQQTADWFLQMERAPAP